MRPWILTFTHTHTQGSISKTEYTSLLVNVDQSYHLLLQFILLSRLNLLDELKCVRFDSKFMYPLHLVLPSPHLVPPTPIGRTESRPLLHFRQCSSTSNLQYRVLPILTCQTTLNLLPPVEQSPAHSYLSDSIPPTQTCHTEKVRST